MPIESANTPTASPMSRKRKAVIVVSSDESSGEASNAGVGKGISRRGKNWGERDSILLVKAYVHKEQLRKRTPNVKGLC